jgi:hypothetical protein
MLSLPCVLSFLPRDHPSWCIQLCVFPHPPAGTAPGLTGRSVVVYVLLMCIVGVPAAVLSLVTTMLAATIRTFCRRDKLP